MSNYIPYAIILLRTFLKHKKKRKCKLASLPWVRLITDLPNREQLLVVWLIKPPESKANVRKSRHSKECAKTSRRSNEPTEGLNNSFKRVQLVHRRIQLVEQSITDIKGFAKLLWKVNLFLSPRARSYSTSF